jgi:hypothetical protein
LRHANREILAIRRIDAGALQYHIVNAGEKMHRRAGVKMHHARSRRSFPVRSMSLLSRPDLAIAGDGAQRRGWEERSHAQHREHGEHRTFPAVSTVAC